MSLSEVVLHRQGGVDIEALIRGTLGEDEVVAQLHFGTNGEMLVGIVPQLRFGKQHQLAVVIGLLAAP